MHSKTLDNHKYHDFYALIQSNFYSLFFRSTKKVARINVVAVHTKPILSLVSIEHSAHDNVVHQQCKSVKATSLF